MKELVEEELTKVKCWVVMSDGAVYRDDWLARVLYERVKETIVEELTKIRCERSCTDVTFPCISLQKTLGEQKRLFMTFCPCGWN